MLSSLITSCSTNIAVHYPNNGPQNITIHITAEKSNNYVTSVDISAGVNELNKDCDISHKGFINLTSGENKLSIKPNITTYLVLQITQDGRMGKQTFQRGTLIKPEMDKKYEIVMNYIDSMFDFNLYEVRESKRKTLDILPLTACQPKR